MRQLSFLILIVLLTISHLGQAQEATHGEGFTMDCSNCHTEEGWNELKDSLLFDHNQETSFLLTGQHQVTDCKACHTNLKFKTTPDQCISCHQDMHANTLGPDCDRCHKPESWIINDITLLHDETRFPLLGTHAITDCKACHKDVLNLKFEPLEVECISCHQDDYLATTDPNHQALGYSQNCVECHSPRSAVWGASDFEHSFFPLNGGHSISCQECHQDGNYLGLSNHCYTCHEVDYQETTLIDHSALGFSEKCDNCHTTNPDWQPATYHGHDERFFPVYSGNHHGEWNSCQDCHTQSQTYSMFSCIDCHEHSRLLMNAEHREEEDYEYNSFACFGCHPTGSKNGSFNHSETNFPLTGAHTKSTCSDCHVSGFSGLSTYCNDCHQADYTDAKEPNHQEAGIPDDCEPCHNTIDWAPSYFNHTSTGFELTGGHSRVQQCAECHSGTLVNAQSDCITCHEEQYNEAPDHTAQSFPLECLICHDSENWEETYFDHNNTAFPLTGQHSVALCSDCHEDQFTGTPTNCSECHIESYQTAQQPNHTTAGIPTDCVPCHNSSAWKPSEFNHDDTGFVLEGAHNRIPQCAECHVGSLVNAVADCYSCHQVQYQEAPDHLAQSYPIDCTICHNSDSWDDADFDHNNTNFPLTGQHSTTECAECHTDGFSGTSTDCNACHQDKYNSAQDPNHTSAGLPFECEPCHNTTAWTPSDFDHEDTGFILDGAHNRIPQCSQCHIGSVVNTPSDCYSCHTEQYNQAPEHAAQAYPHDCTLCHNNNSWEETNFDHNNTNFPLTGQHVNTQCSDCHTNGFSGTPTDCNDCHNEQYASAQDPNHSAAGLPLECEPCHNTTAWTPSDFDHEDTGFILDGAHASIPQCAQCHIGSVENTSSDCYSCHTEQYNQAPNHSAQAYPHDCTLCHNKTNWEDAHFDHNNTDFPLLGQHVNAQCTDCHASGFVGTPKNCDACHLDNYNNAQEPNHGNAGIPTECEDCHTEQGWTPSSFNHTTTGFILDGAHASIPQCAQCHIGTLVNAQSSCFSCHESDYNSTNNPDHQAAHFPTTCEECHTTRAWEPATFDHDGQYFPIYSGEHKGEWNSCTDCHTNASNYSIFSCIDCHEHNRSEMDDEHRGVNDYRYESQACYSCHPDGRDSPLIRLQP